MSFELDFQDLDDVKDAKKLSEEDSLDHIRRYERRFLQAMTLRSHKEEIWAELDTFDRGEQWKDQPIPPWIPKPVDNWIRYIRKLRRANLASAIPKPTFSPIHQEDYTAIQQMQMAHDHVWETDRIERTIRRCIDRSILQGTAIAYVYEDDTHVGGKWYNDKPEDDPAQKLYQGKICVRRFPITNFFPDPDAYRLDQCKFIEVTELIPLEVVKNNPAFKEYAGDKLDLLHGYYTDKDGGSGNILNRDTEPAMNQINLTGDELATLHVHWERFINEHGRWQLDVSYYLRHTNFFLLRLEDVEPNEYPFAILYDEEEEQDFWGTSECMTVMETQKTINKADQIAAIIGILNQNPQKVVLRDSGINAQDLSRTGNMPGKVWISHVPNPIEVIQPPDIPKGLFELKNSLTQGLKDRLGLNEAYSGGNVGSLTTSTGVNDLIERATITDKDKMIQIDEFVERISHLIGLFIMHKWNEERPLAVQGVNGTTLHSQWQPIDDPENFEWKVRVDTYAKAPVTQASRRQQADKLMQMQGQFQFSPAIITPEEWIQLQDFDIKDQILARMQADRQIQSQNQVQQAVIKALGGAANISLSIKDPNTILDYLNQEKQAAQQQAQLLAQIQTTNAAIDLTGQAPQQAQQQGDMQMPQGVTGQVQAANMANGS